MVAPKRYTRPGHAHLPNESSPPRARPGPRGRRLLSRTPARTGGPRAVAVPPARPRDRRAMRHVRGVGEPRDPEGTPHHAQRGGDPGTVALARARPHRALRRRAGAGRGGPRTPGHADLREAQRFTRPAAGGPARYGTVESPRLRRRR